MSGKRTKMKTYTATAVLLNVKKVLRAANGGRQFTIVVRAPTKKRVLELLQMTGGRWSMRELNEFNGCTENEDFKFQPPEDEVIYFHNDHYGTPHYLEYLRYDDWKQPS